MIIKMLGMDRMARFCDWLKYFVMLGFQSIAEYAEIKLVEKLFALDIQNNAEVNCAFHFNYQSLML